MDDLMYPVEMAMKMHQDINGSHLVVVSGAAHAAIIEKPAVCDQAIIAWANEIR